MLGSFYELSDVKLGDGGYSEIFSARRIRDDVQVAVKVVNVYNSMDLNALDNEIKILNLLVPNSRIIQLYDHFEDEFQHYLVMELMKGGDLFDNVLNKRYYSEKDARDILHDILLATKYCHEKHIIHRDIKPENLLFDKFHEHAKLKLADFGTAIVIDDSTILTEQVGSPPYMAPEVCDGRTAYSYSADLWSIGVVFYILLFGIPPFDESDETKLFEAIKIGKFSFPSEPVVSEEAKNLISALLEKDPQRLGLDLYFVIFIIIRCLILLSFG